MTGYPAELLAELDGGPLSASAESLAALCRERFSSAGHGRLPEWLAAIEALPVIAPARRDFSSDAVTASSGADREVQAEIERCLKALRPWRKGPFDLHGVRVDSEWRSNLKWDRLTGALDFRGRHVLDVGSGNGYYGWRMLGAGARRVIGIDPSLLYVAQFLAVARLVGPAPNVVLPLALEDLQGNAGFDIVCSMGVLYHRRSPLDHLARLGQMMGPGGTLVLETLTVAGGADTVLVPAGRYAKMRNVYFLPSVPMLEIWLNRSGFEQCRVHQVSPTTPREQRATEWMEFESLADFLDPEDRTRTVEGHPAPIRCLLTARKPT